MERKGRKVRGEREGPGREGKEGAKEEKGQGGTEGAREGRNGARGGRKGPRGIGREERGQVDKEGAMGGGKGQGKKGGAEERRKGEGKGERDLRGKGRAREGRKEPGKENKGGKEIGRKGREGSEWKGMGHSDPSLHSLAPSLPFFASLVLPFHDPSFPSPFGHSFSSLTMLFDTHTLFTQAPSHPFPSSSLPHLPPFTILYLPFCSSSTHFSPAPPSLPLP